ncbi:MAG: hypothetical protein R3F50_08145 [Gammaproteobacteria bacterium]
MRDIVDIETLSNLDLLQLHSSIIEELKRRGVVRTKNNPVGDYTEWLVARGLGLELANNSVAGFDGIDRDGVKIQIKGRRITPDNNSRQLSAIRNLESQDFDQLAAVIFDENYNILDAVIMPHEVIGDYASYRAHTNAHILHLRGAILSDPRVRDIRAVLDG